MFPHQVGRKLNLSKHGTINNAPLLLISSGKGNGRSGRWGLIELKELEF